MQDRKRVDPNKLLEKLDCKYGSPMGRRTIKDNPAAKVRLFRMKMVDSCYDVGGAYWGMGTPIYVAIGEGFQAFTRQHSREDAKTYFKEEFPDLRFYR